MPRPRTPHAGWTGACGGVVVHPGLRWHSRSPPVAGRDDGRAKFAALRKWAENFYDANGRHPRIWWDKVRLPLSRSLLVVLNSLRHCLAILPSDLGVPPQACIDQNDIDSSLTCLPVFLSGCQTLLIVAGRTYCSRLWCCMELFTFLRSERHHPEPPRRLHPSSGRSRSSSP